MIREMTPERLRGIQPDSEAATKLLALTEAYGLECPFVRYWEGEGRLAAALMEGRLTLFSPEDLGEETALFISMQPEIRCLRTDRASAERLGCLLPGWRLETGQVMRPGRMFEPSGSVSVPSPRALYPVLAACFPGELPAFDAWYADVHHRLRHGLCRLAAVETDGGVAACAMTTAECAGGAVIGAVATLPDYRGRGYASACVSTLAASLQKEGRRIYLSPKNAGAQRLYAGLGFVPCGEWGTLQRL